MKRTKSRQLLMYFVIVALFGSLLADQKRTGRQAVGTRGRHFPIAFLEIEKNAKGFSWVYVTSEDTGTVSLYAMNTTYNKAVIKGRTTIFQLLPEIRMEDSRIARKGVVLTSTVTVSVYATNSWDESRDVYMVYPVVALGNEYMVVTFTPRCGALLGVIGVYDNTDVQIRLKTELPVTYNGKIYENGESIYVTLNKSDVFQLKHTSDLTGTIVTSSQPVSALGGNVCAAIPRGQTTYSHVISQLPPLVTWGREFITMPNIDRRVGDVFRIVTAYDNTTVSIIGKRNFTLRSGDFEEFELANDEVRSVFATKPCMLVQFNKGSLGTVRSEPFMLTIPAIAQYTTGYNLAIPQGDQYISRFSNYINIIIDSSKIQGLVYNISLFKGNFTWMTVPNTRYSFGYNKLKTKLNKETMVSLTHRSKDVHFGVSVFAHTDYNGYGFIGGMRMAHLNYCRLTSAIGDGMDNDCDGRIDEEIANGIDDDNDGQIDEDLRYISNICNFTTVLESTNKHVVNAISNYYTVHYGDCKNTIKRTWYIKSDIGAPEQQIEEEFSWEKPILNISLQKTMYLDQTNNTILGNLTPIISSPCNTDNVNVTHFDLRITMMGVVNITRTWVVREACGRTTVVNQTIIECVRIDDGNTEEAVSNIKIVLGICFGVLSIHIVVAFFCYGRWKKHKARRIVVSVQRIDVLEANNAMKWQYSNPTAMEDCVYAEISIETPNIKDSVNNNNKVINVEKAAVN